MYQYKGFDDTIAAISTPIGRGGIGIVRISGKHSIEIADKIFKASNGRKIESFDGFSVHYGKIVRDNETIDEALLTLMRNPKSYTTEDVVEISCHGGATSVKTILDLVLDAGARIAEPGEFTKRAFLYGRIDLTQAEAVLDIINAKTDAFLKISSNQLKGTLSLELESIRKELMSCYVELEAFISFPEDTINNDSRDKIKEKLKEVQANIENLLANSKRGIVLREGIKIVICGKTNVGKSSLMNVLLETPRAIVSDMSGTTRDAIEEVVQIEGIPFQIIDTAGILTPRNAIEEEATKRSNVYIQNADQVLLVLDNSVELSEDDRIIIRNIDKKNALVLINKIDLPTKIDRKAIVNIFAQDNVLDISAINKTGIDILREHLVKNALQGYSGSTKGVIVNNLRHISSLKQAVGFVIQAIEILSSSMSIEFVSEEIKIAVNSLDAITGRNIDSDLIDDIFSKFCVGK